MSSRIGVNRAASAHGWHADRAELFRQFLSGLSIVEVEVQVDLLRILGIRPSRRREHSMLKSEHRKTPIFPCDDHPLSVILHSDWHL